MKIDNLVPPLEDGWAGYMLCRYIEYWKPCSDAKISFMCVCTSWKPWLISSI